MMIEFINKFSNSPDFTLCVFIVSLLFWFGIYTVVRKRHTPFKDDYLSGTVYVALIACIFATTIGVFMPRIILIKDADELLKSKDFIKSVMSFYFAALMICYIKFYEVSFTKDKYDVISKEKVRPYFNNLDFMFGLFFTMIFSLGLSIATFIILEHSKPFVNKFIMEQSLKQQSLEKETVAVDRPNLGKAKIIIENNKAYFTVYFDRNMLKIELPKNWYIKNKDAVIRFSPPESGEAALLTFNNISDKNSCLNVMHEASKLNAKLVWLQNKSVCDNISNNFALIIPIQ